MNSSEAYNDIMATFLAAWTPTGVPVAYPNVPPSAALTAAIASGRNAWCRVSIKPNTRAQTSLAGVGGRLFNQTGIFIAEVYTPSGDGGVLDRTLTRTIERSMEGISTPNRVWFRNVRTSSIGPDGSLWHSNVTAEFEYDEVR